MIPVMQKKSPFNGLAAGNDGNLVQYLIHSTTYSFLLESAVLIFSVPLDFEGKVSLIWDACGISGLQKPWY